MPTIRRFKHVLIRVYHFRNAPIVLYKQNFEFLLVATILFDQTFGLQSAFFGKYISTLRPLSNILLILCFVSFHRVGSLV